MHKSVIIGSKSLSWKYSMGQKNGLHAFGYNSAESEFPGLATSGLCDDYRSPEIHFQMVPLQDV